MTIKKLMMGAGAVDGPQVIAPSSNDWDYTFDSGNEHPVAGNPLGDHTIGAYWKATGANNGISSLITLDGDFEIEFTLAETNQSEFGVHAIDEDDTRTADSRVGMSSMTNSFWYRDESVTDFMIGSSAQSDTHTFADGSVVKIERVSGTIKVYDDDVVVHTYGSTYSGTMRFGAGDPGPAEADYDNFKITDTEKIQREGNWNEGTASTNANGDANTYREGGFRFPATRSGSVQTVSFDATGVGNSYTSHVEIWSDSGGSPSAQIGSDSNTIDLTSTGTKTYTLTDVTLTKGTHYWAILFDNEANGSGDVSFQKVDELTHLGSGRHDTPTSMTDNLTGHWKCEMVVDTSAGEPTPDHDTLLLIHSDTSDGSTTFVDSSQNGHTVTVGGDAQHDTAQTLGFGTSSILFDGTGDYLQIANQAPFSNYPALGPAAQNFTIDAIIRMPSIGTNSCIMAAGDGAANANCLFTFHVNAAGKVVAYLANNASTGITVTGSTTLSADTNYHVALVKLGSVFTIYLNGTSDGTGTNALTLTTTSDPFRIGIEANGSWPFNGWIKEPRFSLNARWDANFTAPSAAYP